MVTAKRDWKAKWKADKTEDDMFRKFMLVWA